MRAKLFIAVALFIAALQVAPTAYPEAPAPGLILPCQVTEVVDGDTITVEVKLKIRVRLQDCWAAELKTTNPKEQAMGEDSFRFMAEKALDRQGVMIIPFSARNRLDDLFTFGRILGDVHLSGDPDSLIKQSIDAGHSFATKEQLLQAISQDN